MNMTATYTYTSVNSTSPFSVWNNSPPSGSEPLSSSPIRICLIFIYTAVLVVGAMGTALMVNVLKGNLRSVSTVAVLNLIMAHLIFLPTIPFRIYYYVKNSWDFPSMLCKTASSMIHLHMYLSFIIYVVILTLRFHNFYKRSEGQAFHRKLHSLGASVVVWAVVLVIVLTVSFLYGDAASIKNDTICFRFGFKIAEPGVHEVNYIISAVFIAVPCVLCGIQAHILLLVTRKFGATSCSQQEFWAQMKSLRFVLIMLVCFVPYHIFRMHYLRNTEMEPYNEIFLAMTGLSCSDLLTFVGRGPCQSCRHRIYVF